MSTFAYLLTIATIAQSTDDGLSFTEVLADLPTDPASVFTISLMVASIGLVLWFGRPRGGKGGKPAPSSPARGGRSRRRA